MAIPIWKDKFVTLGSGANYDFTVYDAATNAGNIIYQGRAYKKPGDANVMVRVNDICADYLAQKLDALTTTGTTASHVFSVYVNTTLKESFTFYMNWEYKDGSVDKVQKAANDPITRRIQVGMRFPFSMLGTYPDTGSITIVGTKADGTTTTNVPVVGVSGPFNYYFDVLSNRKHILAYLTSLSDVRVEYDVIPKCHRYALYYVNALGGVDVLVIEGTYRMKDDIDRKTYKRSYDNGNLANRGEVNYRNNIGRSWELHTGWLTDAEASRMGHLLGSPLVCLCDCDDSNQLHPVIITNKDCPYKTYKDGMINYQIDVTLARDMIRQ